MTTLSNRRVFFSIAIPAFIAFVAVFSVGVSLDKADVATRSNTATKLTNTALKAQLKVAKAQNTVLTANKPNADRALANEVIARQQADANNKLVDKLAAKLAHATGSQFASLREQFAAAVYASPNGFTYNKVPDSVFGQAGQFMVVHAILDGDPGIHVYRNKK